MGFFNFRWLRRFVRRHTTYIPPETALTWKERLSILYMIIGWNALGTVMYLCYTGKSDWAAYYGLKTDEEINQKPAIRYAEILGIKQAHVVTFKGFSKKSEFDYVAPLLDAENEAKTTTSSEQPAV